MLEYHQPECNILPDHISNRMPCRNLRLYSRQNLEDLRVRSGMQNLESESLVDVLGKNTRKVEVCCQANAQYTNW